MTNQSWNSDDYLVDFEDIHYSGEIVKAPVIWKIGVVYKFLQVVLADAVSANMADAVLSGLVLTLSSVDYLAGYYSGKKTDYKDYIGYMNNYFPQEYSSYADSIYLQLRCGLLHNLVANNPWSENKFQYLITKNSKDHLKNGIDRKLVFSVRTFIEDARRSFVMYSYNLIMKPDEYKDSLGRFEKRFDRLAGKGSVMVATLD